MRNAAKIARVTENQPRTARFVAELLKGPADGPTPGTTDEESTLELELGLGLKADAEGGDGDGGVATTGRLGAIAGATIGLADVALLSRPFH